MRSLERLSSPSFERTAARPPAHLHLAFKADTCWQVDAFRHAALEAADHGTPGLRAHYHADYYAAFVIGPDRHDLEVVCHAPRGLMLSS